MRCMFHSFWTAGLPLIVTVIVCVIAIPNLVARRAPYSRGARETMRAATQAMVYAKEKGVYPTSIAVLREEGYANISDKDPWGNEWVLSPVLTRGNEPKEGDNVYVFSRGPKGTGVYPEPFTSDTGEDGSIGYSSVDGRWGYQ